MKAVYLADEGATRLHSAQQMIMSRMIFAGTGCFL